MSFDYGALDAALTAAVGDDQSLIAELRAAFLESAKRQVDLLGDPVILRKLERAVSAVEAHRD